MIIFIAFILIGIALTTYTALSNQKEINDLQEMIRKWDNKI